MWLPSSQVFRVHNFTHNSSRVIESTKLDVTLIYQLKFRPRVGPRFVRRHRGLTTWSWRGWGTSPRCSWRWWRRGGIFRTRVRTCSRHVGTIFKASNLKTYFKLFSSTKSLYNPLSFGVIYPYMFSTCFKCYTKKLRSWNPWFIHTDHASCQSVALLWITWFVTSQHQTSIHDHVVLFTCGLLLNPKVCFGPFQDSNLA